MTMEMPYVTFVSNYGSGSLLDHVRTTTSGHALIESRNIDYSLIMSVLIVVHGIDLYN